MQVLQQLLGFAAVGRKVRGDDVHIVAGPHGLFLLLDLHLVQVRDLALDGLDGADLIHGLNVHVHNEGALHVEEVRQHAVIQFRGEDLQKADRAHLPAHAKAVAFRKFKGAGRDKVLDGQAGGGQPVP